MAAPRFSPGDRVRHPPSGDEGVVFRSGFKLPGNLGMVYVKWDDGKGLWHEEWNISLVPPRLSLDPDVQRMVEEYLSAGG